MTRNQFWWGPGVVTCATVLSWSNFTLETDFLSTGVVVKDSKKQNVSSPLTFNIVRSLRDREVVCSASDHQGSNFELCVWRTVAFHSSHHLQ